MADQRYIDFIENIILRTKEKNISWKYLDKNEDLYVGMGWYKTEKEYGLFLNSDKKIIKPNFNLEDSFFAHMGNMYLVIYVWGNRPASFYVVPNTYKKIVSLAPEEYGDYITRLLNLVQSQFPNAETFIDDFLKKEAEKKPN